MRVEIEVYFFLISNNIVRTKLQLYMRLTSRSKLDEHEVQLFM